MIQRAPNPPDFAQPRLSRVKARSSPARGHKFGCVCSYMAGHYPGILMTGHIGTNTPKFVPPRWGRPRVDPTQTGFVQIWVGLESANHRHSNSKEQLHFFTIFLSAPKCPTPPSKMQIFILSSPRRLWISPSCWPDSSGYTRTFLHQYFFTATGSSLKDLRLSIRIPIRPPTSTSDDFPCDSGWFGEFSLVPVFGIVVPFFVPSFRFSVQGNIRQNHPFGNHPFVNPALSGRSESLLRKPGFN